MEEYMKISFSALVLALAFATQAFALQITLSPVQTAIEIVGSITATVASPFVSSTATTVGAANRQELEAARDHANNFLYNDKMSKELTRVLANLRTDANTKEAVAGQNDRQIALAVVIATTMKLEQK
jgi:hypothetical protein